MKIAFNPSTVEALITPPNNKDITFDLRGRNIFARGVKFCGTDTNTWRDIKINNVSIGSNTLDLRNGSNTTLTNTNGVVTINSTWRPVVDNLTSDSTTSSLSAKQGKVLKSLIDGKSNSGHTHDDRYLKLTGGTMASNALITFADSGSWGTDKGPQGARGGLYWTGQSDYAKLYAEETAGDNLDLVIQFGDDNSNGLSIRNKANTQTSYISAGGVITTGTFKGNLDWSYITNKPSSYTPSAHTHAWNSLTHSSTTENQAILTNGKANGWKLYTLNISRWDNAANNAHSHSNKSVLDGITSILVNNWNTAYTFVNTITGTDTDKVINKWDEIVNFLAGITEDNKLNTLLNSKLSVYELANNTNVGTIKNNGIYYSTTDASSGTLTNSPFNTGFALINMTSYDGGDDLRRSRLAFNAYGEIKVSDDRDLANTAEIWCNVLTSKNSGISGSTIKLNGTSITVYSSSTADGRYVKKSGDTMSGVLTIDTTNFGALTIKRNDDANGASIQFRGKSSVYGYIGLNNSTKDKQFLRWNSDTSKTYTILDTSSTYTSNGKGVINGTTITQVDNATNSTNSTNARKLVNWYSTRPTSLNAQFGDGSLRIFYATSSTTEGKPAEDSHILHLAWDNNGGWDAQLAVHTRSGKISTRAQNGGTWQPWKTLAFTTDIPSSLKNPYSLTTFGVVYDGSAAKTVTTSTFISLVTEGTSTVTDGTMFITSYASNSGFADTNAVNIPYKRKAIHLWEYIKTKTNSLYATKSHNHDDRYLKLTGGIMTGTINRRSGGSTISGRDHAIIRLTYAPGGSSWNPIACVDTETGTWTLGHLSSGSSDTNFHFCFSTNADYNAGNNNGNYVTLRNKVGTIALLSDIPSSLKNPHALTISLNGTSQGPYDGSAAKNINITPGSIGAATSGHNHDSSYVKYTKVTKSTADNANATPYLYNVENEEVISGYYKYWYIFNMGQYSGGNFGTLIAMPYQDSLTDSELFIRSAKSGSWRTWRRILHSNNYASILDSRYYTKSEVNTKLGTYLSLSGGTVTGNIILKGGTSADMTYAGNVHPYIRFDNLDSSLNVSLIFTDYDTYRRPAGIKLVGNQGNEWFEAANIYATTFYGTLSGNASSANKLTTARNIALGTDLRGSANFDGSSNITISANINACTVQVSSTNGLPFKRIAHFETGSSWNDNALLLYISLGYINGSNGICRVEFRTDNISSSSTSVTASAAVRWLVRNGYGLDSLYAGYYVTTSKAYIDIYLKTTGSYQGTVIRVLLDSRGSINSNVLLINSYYYSDTNHKEAYNSIEAASTALYNRAYTRIVSGSDVGTVSYSNSTGSVHWNNVTNKPSTFAPAAHTHTVFKNNLMIKGTNGVSDSASIHLGIGDSDTGFKWISDGKCLIYANNVAVGEWTSGGMNWFKNPTVNGNKIWNAGNDGSGSGLDADLLDGWHLDSIRKNVGYSWSAKYRINNWSRIIKIDNYSNILLAINFSQNSQASNHLYLISTGYGCGNIVQLGANGFSGNSAIKIRLTENTATSHNVEIYSTYGYNGATELSINCNYTRIDGNSTITTYLTYTAGGGTVRKEITSSYNKIVANLQGNSDTTTKLQTPRQINGTNFDGSANITTSYWGTTRTISLTGAVTGSVSTNGSGNITINTTYGTGNITNLDNRYVKKAGDTMLGNLAFASGKQTRWTAHGTSYITDGNADIGTSLGGDLANLVISSWNGVSFTTSCSGQTYTNKTAVGINCRTGIVYAANFVGALQGNASSATNADKVDGYHASGLWRSDGATWNPGANVSLNASANNQEWSFDIRRNGYTGCYWHVWDSALNSMLKVNADNGKVYAPYNFVGNLEGNASTATALTTNAGNSINPVYFSGGKPIACTMSTGRGNGILRSFGRGAYTSANLYFGNGTIVTIDPKGTGCISANDTILSLGDSSIRNTQLLVAYDRDGVYYRRITDGLSYGDWKRLAFTTDNVASATKLQTSRLLWGQPFDGTSDVSGFMKNVTGLIHGNNIGDDWSDGNNTHPWYGIDYRHCIDSSETGKAYTSISSYFGLYFKTGGYRFIFDGGNVGIGTNAPAYKLHVNGTFRATNSTVSDLFVNTGDATLKIYTGRTADGLNDGNICFLTSIDATDGQSHAYPTLYLSRCNIVLQPRGGLVYIGTNPGTGNTTYKLYVNSKIFSNGGFVKNGSSDSYVLLGGGGHKAESSLRVAYASSTGNADTVDGYHETAFPRLVGIKGNTWNWNDVIRAGYYKIQSGTITNHPSGIYPYGMAEVITTENHNDGENRELQIYYPHSQTNNIAIWLRMHNSSTQGNGWGSWVGVPNTNGNIASATKLLTARLINGTNFDGTSNITTSYWGTTRTLTIGNSGKSVNGSANISWSLSEIGAASSSHSHNYAANENYGGFTKSGRLPISGFYQSTESESGGNAPWSGWMHLINCLHSNTGNNYALLIAASFFNNNTFKIRVTNNNVNNAWRDIIHSGNIGSQTVANAYHLRINSANTWSTWYWAGLSGLPSWLWGSNDGTNMYVWNPSNFRVAYASSAGNADTLDGTHLNGIFTAFGNNAHNITATIGGVTKSFLVNWAADSDKLDGYHENSFLRYRGDTSTNLEATLWSLIGIKLYNNALPDNLTGVYNYGSVISLPGSSSRFEIYASHLSSNGNGLYYRSGWGSDKKTWLKFIDSSNIGSQSVNYANSAGNADKLDGIHANGLLTALSNSNNGISITVGGTTKSVSNISVNYASSAGSATKVIVNLHTANDTNYPLVWSNLANSSTVTENQLYKSWSDLYYNPKNKKLTVGGSVVASSFVKRGGTSLQLLRADGGIATFNWSGQSGLPTWLWGGNNEHSYYVYNPSNFRVAYATSSGNADTLDGEHAKNFVRAGFYENNDLNSLDTYSFIRSVNSQVSRTSPKGDIGWYNVILLVHRNGDGDGPNYIGLIALGMTSNVNDIFFRCRRTDPWKTIIHSNNYTEYINNYYWANVKISTSSSTTTSPTVYTLTATRVCAGHNPGIDNSISCSNWFRSSGATGWYNTTYNGGWYMSDTSWIRAHNGVGIYTSGNVKSSGFHHVNHDNNDAVLLAGGSYKTLNSIYGGDSNHPVFLGYLNLDHGSDGTVSSSFYCLGYSVPFTYTRGGNYCKISIPDTTHQAFYIKAATASVNYSGGGMDTWTGNRRGAGAWWLHCYASSSNEVRVKGFHLKDTNNDSWWGGNPLWSENSGANRITVCIFGYVTFR